MSDDQYFSPIKWNELNRVENMSSYAGGYYLMKFMFYYACGYLSEKRVLAVMENIFPNGLYDTI